MKFTLEKHSNQLHGVRSVIDRLVGVTARLAFVLTERIIAAVKSTFVQRGCPIGICGAILVYATAAFAQSSSNEFPSGGHLMPATDSGLTNQRNDCETRFSALVTDLESVLASDPETVAPVYEVFYKYFPVQRCSIEDVLGIARASRFFTGSEEMNVLQHRIQQCRREPTARFCRADKHFKGNGQFGTAVRKSEWILSAANGGER